MASHRVESLELVPGQCLGPFQLGRSLYQTLPQLRNNQYTPAEVSWAQAGPSSEPILIHVLKPDLRLLFSTSQAQRLVAIELSNPGPWLRYKGVQWTVREGSSVEKTLLRLFGPTYQASTSPHHPDVDFLCYPGVAFGLKRKQAAAATTTTEPGDELERLIITPNTEEEGESSNSFSKVKDLFSSLLVTRLEPRPLGFDNATVQLGKGDQKTSIVFSREDTSDAVVVTLGVTHAEDLLCDFGQPGHTYFKDDDRMAIHRYLFRSPSPRSPAPESNSRQESKDQPYFLNHFDLGVDFLMSGSTHRLLKVVLHSNNPGEVLFGRYEHCPWRLSWQDDPSSEVSSSDSATAIIEHLNKGAQAASTGTPASESAPAPQRATGRNRDGSRASSAAGPAASRESFKLDRTADLPDDVLLGKETDLLGFPGVVLERTDADAVETLWIFDANLA